MKKLTIAQMERMIDILALCPCSPAKGDSVLERHGLISIYRKDGKAVEVTPSKKFRSVQNYYYQNVMRSSSSLLNDWFEVRTLV